MFFRPGKVTKRRWQIFRSHRRGFYSFVVLMLFLGMACLGELICNHRPLLINYQDTFYFPFLKVYPETTFGGFFATETNYKDEEIQTRLSAGDNWVMWAPIRYGPSEVDFDLEHR